MNLVFRIVFGITVTVLFLIVCFLTFFNPSEDMVMNKLRIEDSKKLHSTGALFYKKLSQYESLYSTLDINISDIISDRININKQGKYIYSMRNIVSAKDFTGTGYVISPEGIGETYIDNTTKKGRVFVYAKNTPVEIYLVNDNEDEIYTTIYLSPGMYLEFRVGIGESLKNSDRLRVSTINKLGYAGSVSSIDVNSYIGDYFSGDDYVLYDSLEHIDLIDDTKEAYFTSILTSEINKISGLPYINRYLHLFVNDEKKKIFYKNILLEGYISLLNSKKIDESVINQIKKDEQKLQNIDMDSYNEIIEIRGGIISSLHSNQNADYISSKVAFAKLLSDEFSENKWLYPLYSFSLFSGKYIEEDGSSKIIKSFFDSFSVYLDTYDSPEKYYDYFLYFLEQRLLFLTGKENTVNMDNTIETLINYGEISSQANYLEKNQKITQLYSIVGLIESLEGFMRKVYFLEERDDNQLLVLNKNNSLSGDNLIKIENALDKLLFIYDENNSLLDINSSRDSSILKKYKLVTEKTTEYLLAIGNYSKYIDEYNVSKNTILNIDTIGLTGGEINIDSGRKYLNQFLGIGNNNFTIDFVDDLFYRVSDLVISGKKFSFDLYPFSGSRLKNIYIDGELQTTQYTLDLIELDWKDKMKSASIDLKDQYDFSRFFIITFFSQTQKEVELFVKEYKEEESKAEIVFKRDILLGSKGEFKILESFMDIEYDDITLVQEGNSYDIFLNDVAFQLNLEDGETVTGIMNGQYVLDSNTHNFKNVNIKIESESRGINNKLLYEFGGRSISIVGNIFINDAESDFNGFIDNHKLYIATYNEISSGVTDNELIVEYTPTNKKTRFKFDYNKKSFTIILQDQDITGVYKGTTKVSLSPIEVSEIKNYLE